MIDIKKLAALALVSYLLVYSIECYAQVSISQNHPELIWMSFETEHFRIIYHQGIETLANEVAMLAEQVYYPITQDLGTEPPSRTAIIVTDYLDYSNGLATPLGHYIIIWCQSETKYMTGDMKWLRAVVAHEFAHIVNFWAFRGFPGFWRELLALGFVPTWVLEGIAEYEAERWCDHRDMLLRVVAYHHQLLPYKKLTGYIGSDLIAARLVYEQGHSLIRYIAYKFGPDKIRELIRNFRKRPYSFNLALKKTIGISERQLFSEWKAEIDAHYHKRYRQHVLSTEIGHVLATPFQGNYGARWSPDGNKIAIVGIEKYNTGVQELFLLDTRNSKITKIAGPFVNSFFSWSPDGKTIVYSQQHRVSTGAVINDLFLVDVNSFRIKRLTTHERATDPYWCPDGKHIVYAIHQGTRSNLAVLNIETGQRRILTDFPEWTEVFTPCWSPQGEEIAFSIWDHQGNRDIACIRPDGTGLVWLTKDPIDDRYPAWCPDGQRLAFISYRNGIPNLYIMNLADRNFVQITDSPGGIFNPSWLPKGDRLAVVTFEQRNMTQIVTLPASATNPINPSFSGTEWLPFHRFSYMNTASAASIPFLLPTEGKHKPYCSFKQVRPQLLLPYADQSEAGWQPGLALLAADPLERHTFLGAVTYRQRPHFWIDYVNRQYAPTIGISINKTTIDHGDFLTLKDERRGVIEVLPLYENYWSGTASWYWNINYGRSLLSDHLLWFSATCSYRNIINREAYRAIDTAGWVYPLLQGWTNYVTLGYSWLTYRPDISADIHPKSGRLYAVQMRYASRRLGSALEFSQIGLAVIRRWELPFAEHVIALRGGASFYQGDQPVQARLSLGASAIRGSGLTLEGDRQFYCNFEYRFPLIKDLGLKIWIAYFEQLCAALFIDSGSAWGHQLATVYQLHYLPFQQAPWLSMTGMELRHRLYIFGKIPLVINGGYAISAKEPRQGNFFFRLGSAF
ncbi:MAG: hypothetical protein ONB31_01830 [candidate division KSB1 bacterium]|nr:hypothetical protein [candidate division KSB1 bacterium]MDZ7356489.1 hypothetical protein [candidate division KSB1 bacterium]MDZ7400496.1 hypothetical protein [candidate division KSB1 bacterium]